MKLRTLMMAAATLEVVTGIALLVSPALVARLLLAQDVAGTGAAIGRLCGVALLSLGVACWPGHEESGDRVVSQALPAMLIYNSLAAAYLGFLRSAGGFSGVLLWPAIVLHAALAVLFAGAFRKDPERSRSQPQETPR